MHHCHVLRHALCMLVLPFMIGSCRAWQPVGPTRPRRAAAATEALAQSLVPDGQQPVGRSQALRSAAAAVLAVLAANPTPATALVKGNAPPSNYGKRGPTALPDDVPQPGEVTFSVTRSGVRFKDIREGSGAEASPRSVVVMRYRVLKLGKRSYDGISGEATQVFSLGYGEDDDKEGSSVTVPLGVGRVVSALDEAMVGMRVGGVRRVAVRPERGWKKADPKCAGEIDVGAVSGIPGAAISQVEGCIDTSLEPRPMGYGATRRMARRFDETLIVEAELVDIYS